MRTILADNQRGKEVGRAKRTERIRRALKRKGQGERRCVPHAVTANPDSSPALPPAPAVLLTLPPPQLAVPGWDDSSKEREEGKRGAEGRCGRECACAFRLPHAVVVVSSLLGCRCPSDFLRVRRRRLVGRFAGRGNFRVSIRRSIRSLKAKLSSEGLNHSGKISR